MSIHRSSNTHIESAYATMWRRFQNGEPAAGIRSRERGRMNAFMLIPLAGASQAWPAVRLTISHL
jgi:hypothetical protein